MTDGFGIEERARAKWGALYADLEDAAADTTARLGVAGQAGEGLHALEEATVEPGRDSEASSFALTMLYASRFYLIAVRHTEARPILPVHPVPVQDLQVRPFRGDYDEQISVAVMHQEVRAWQLAVGLTKWFGDQSWSDLTRIWEWYIATGGEFWVATDGATAQVIGCVAYRAHNWQTGSVKRFAVRPEYHGQGVGTALMETLVAWARRRRRVRVVTLSTGVTENARGIYERVGFRLDEENVFAPHDDDLHMILHLNGER